MTFSLEIELGWSLGRTGKVENLSPRRRKETEYLERLLHTCDSLDIPLTFDVVGHLFHRECEGGHTGPHDPEWFDLDPCSDVETDPYYYAPDLIDAIVSSETDHELATHTYSHVLFNDCNNDVIEWEISKAQSIHEEAGLATPTSIVPPQHNEVSYEVLEQTGIETIRIPYDERPDFERSMSKANRLREILFGTPPVVEPEREDGLTVTYSTRYPSIAAPFLPSNHRPTHPAFKMMPLPLRRRLHRWNLTRSLQEAKKEGSHVHYWAHLFDIANGYQWPQIERFLERLATERQNGAAKVATMDELQASENGS